MNPGRLPIWQEVAAKQDLAMKAVVEKAIALNKAAGVTASNTHSAADNDMDFGCILCQRPSPVRGKLVGELRFVDSTDIYEYWAGASAKWSLASNSQTHPRVHEILEAKLTSDKRTQKILTDLLNKDPARIRQEVKDVARNRWGDSQRHCGLSWEDACLDFHTNMAAVTTASASQIRRPLYSDSVGKWRRYADHLVPLMRYFKDEKIPIC